MYAPEHDIAERAEHYAQLEDPPPSCESLITIQALSFVSWLAISAMLSSVCFAESAIFLEPGHPR